MNLAEAVLASAGVSAALAAGAAALVVWAGPLDKPVARSSHAIPTVTSGGLAILAAAAAGLAAFGLLAPEGRTDLARVALALGFAGVLGLLGAIDDLFDLGAKPKLLLQAIASMIFAALVAAIEVLPLGFGLTANLGLIAGVLGTGLWLIVATNAVNFMDGANGLAAGCVAIALAALGTAGLLHDQPAVGAAAIIGAAAIVGFLPWNLPARRLFQGDVGALFTGFLAASLAVVGATAQPDRSLSVYLVPFALTPLLTDVLLTLAVRARRGQSLFEGHRDHLYQVWLTRTGHSHAALAVRAWTITAAYAAAGLACEWAPADLRPPLYAAGVAVCTAAWLVTRRKLET
jgi:UDP-GlcNAc:undecaprenyl-phosphate GlcNAc-1-phosphate transferase